MLRGGRAVNGKAMLETDHVLFRAKDERVKVMLKDVRKVEAKDGELRLQHADGALVLDLGAQAEKWADAIRNPKTRADKLGVKPGQKVSVLGVQDPDLAAELDARGADVSTRLRKGADVVFAQIDDPKGLARLAELRASIASGGAIWTITPRGAAGLKDTDVMAAAKKAGLVDLKVVRFNGTHSANKLVIPVKDRK